ncbi:MAG TPA: nitroreductase [Acidimicrobiales bacterium]|jgi:nitroreductase|nr:nitroreductase [Acidimicrobiales bacterium]
MDTLAAIATRRSVNRLEPPGPKEDHLTAILEAAASAPDHEELRPWRFIVLAGEAKAAFGDVLAEAYEARCRADGEEPTDGQVRKERNKLERAPLVVVVAASVVDHSRVPRVEQVSSTAAAAQNALVAATALGYGSMWRTGDAAYDPTVKAALGLQAGDAVVGFLYLGTTTQAPEASGPRAELGSLVRHWQPA